MSAQLTTMLSALRVPPISYTSGDRRVFRWSRCRNHEMFTMQQVADAIPRVVANGTSNYDERISFQYIGKTCILTFPPCLFASIPSGW